MKKIVNIGLIGYGTVGRGVIKILEKHSGMIENRVGAKCRIKSICDIKISGGSGGKYLFTRSYKDLIDDPEIDIIVELIGGYEPARKIVVEAIQNGKHIVTANKAILAKYWDEIFTLASRKRRLVYFEASVGGGIPVLQALNEGLAANEITKVMGILNGTTNFILTKMTECDIDFDSALKMAQKSGFAEADPTFDVDGIDARHKLAILASIAFGAWIKIEDIYCEGIRNVRLKDIEFADKELGLLLKLIGVARKVSNKLELRVYPALISKNHPFASVRDEYNAVQICGDSVGDVILYGKGAGQMAAASSVASDIIFLARQVANGTAGSLAYVVYNKSKKYPLVRPADFKHKYYLRFTTSDRPGVLAKISGILGKHNVSIASVFQKEFSAGRQGIPILIVTHDALEGQISSSIKEINKCEFVKSDSVYLRIQE